MEYDLIVSLGEWCVTSLALRKYNLQKKTLPFDWSGGILWEKCGYGGLSGKVDLICNNFENFFNKDDLENRGPNPKNEDYWFLWIVNKCTGLQYKHDFPSEQDFNISYNEARDKYIRRVKRLYNSIYSADKILFVYMARDVGFSDDYLKEQEVKLKSKFPYKNIDILYIMNDEGYSLEKIEEIKLSNSVKKITFNFGYQSIKDPNDLVLDNIHLRNILNNITLSDVPNLKNIYGNMQEFYLSSINKHLAKHEYDIKLLYVGGHPIKFMIKKWYYFIKKNIFRGKKNNKYQNKYNTIKKLIKDTSNYEKTIY